MIRVVHLDVLLPDDRDKAGRLSVYVNGAQVCEFPVLGRGSAKFKDARGKTWINPARDPMKKFGDTPTGEYQGSAVVSTTGWGNSSYGPWGAVRLRPTGGEALLAQKHGRGNFLIHGGAPGKFDGLRATLGCLRLHDTDMKRLVEVISSAGDSATTQMCEFVDVRVTVREKQESLCFPPQIQPPTLLDRLIRRSS